MRVAWLAAAFALWPFGAFADPTAILAHLQQTPASRLDLSLARLAAMVDGTGASAGYGGFADIEDGVLKAADALLARRQRVRVYTPYGQLLPGMAYLVRRLLENTANESFLRASFTENVPEEQLLRNPLEAGPTSREDGN